MIVQGHANLEFFAELVVNFGRGSLGHQHLDAHLFGPFEVFASAGFVGGNPIDAISDELEAAGVGEFLFHFVADFIAHFAVHGLAGAGLEFLAGIDFQIFEPHARGLIDRLEESQRAVGVALEGEFDAEFLGSGIIAI